MARADSSQYLLVAATPVAIKGGVYALIGKAAGGNLQMQAPDNTFVAVTTVDTPATPVSAIGGSISPIYLPAGSVQIASGGNCWLVGIG
jgi:hypothetical protein